MTEQSTKRRARDKSPQSRWECGCNEPPILLAMYEPGGQVQIKLRDRFYLASGCVHATCPRCGAQHILDMCQSPTCPTPAIATRRHIPSAKPKRTPSSP